jgi:hypothetical protein
MAAGADVITDPLARVRNRLQGDIKVKVAGCVIMYLYRPILTDPVTQVLTVGPDHIF